MKATILLLLLSIVYGSCKSEATIISEVEVKEKIGSCIQKIAKPSSETIHPYWNGYENSTKSIEFVEPNVIDDTLLRLFEGNLAIADLDKNLVLSKYEIGDGNDYGFIDFEIFGYSPKTYRIKNILLPYSFLDGVSSYAKISSNEIIIPYYNDLEGETSILTRWIVCSDSLKFNGYFKNIFGSKYSNILPKEVINSNEFQLILGLTTFGEGGEYGEEYWLGKVVDNNVLDIKDICSTGYESSDDTIKQLTYIRDKKFLIFYENYFKNTNEKFSIKNHISRKKVAKVELK